MVSQQASISSVAWATRCKDGQMQIKLQLGEGLPRFYSLEIDLWNQCTRWVSVAIGGDSRSPTGSLVHLLRPVAAGGKL